MPILSRAELETRLPAADIAQLADLDASGLENAGTVQAALDDAEAEVMGYVAAATPLPVPDPAPEVLKRLVCDVSRYNLYQRHLPEEHPVVIAYRQAVATLRDVASGRMRLPFAGGSAAIGGGGPTASWAPPRRFSDDALRPLEVAR